jgi:hypothetical protein
MKRARQAARPRGDETRFPLPLAIRTSDRGFVEHYGQLGIQGFYFETTDWPLLGQVLRVRLPLVGLGVEVETLAVVHRVLPGRGHVGVVALFGDDIPFETERMIARWLDLMLAAHRQAAAG